MDHCVVDVTGIFGSSGIRGGNAMRKGEQIKKEQGSGRKQEQKGIHLKTHRGDERYHRKNCKKEGTYTADNKRKVE